MIPTEAMSPARTMKSTNVQFSSELSDVRDVTSSHTTASAGEPVASLHRPLHAVGELEVDLLDARSSRR